MYTRRPSLVLGSRSFPGAWILVLGAFALHATKLPWAQVPPAVQTEAIPLLLKDRIIKAYNPERSGVIQIILKPGYYSGYSSTTGATHGSCGPSFVASESDPASPWVS